MPNLISYISKTFIANPIYSITNFYKKWSPWGKVLFFAVLLLIVVTVFNTKKDNGLKEGFVENKQFEFKTGTDIYDDFYADIYDLLVFSGAKTQYEIGEIVNSTKPTQESIILDIGSGTGHHVDQLSKKGFKVTGLDNSSAMIKKAKEYYPKYDFVEGDVQNAMQFQPQSFTHILCMYFTVYYIKDKMVFFNNCFNWLQPGGYLVVHVVDKEMFDPILPSANPLLMLSPQRHAKTRITHSNITFEDFKYNANFELDGDNAKFVEKFSNKTSGKVFRKQEHEMFMESEDDILSMAQEAGFIQQSKIDLIKSGYEYNSLFTFVKPE